MVHGKTLRPQQGLKVKFRNIHLIGGIKKKSFFQQLQCYNSMWLLCQRPRLV